MGLGMLGMGFVNYIVNPKNTKNKKNILINGGTSMQSNGWLKLALFSFVGIIISGVVLQFMTPAPNTTGYHGTQQSMPMQQQSMPMQQQSMPMQQGTMGSMSVMGSGQMDFNIVINRLDQMQMQINQMQQMMNNGMGNMPMQSMPQGSMPMQPMPQGSMPMQSMPADPAAGMSGGSGGGMGMGMMGGMM
ncbi:hypothetical protein [Cellulosilyticum sp. I15G10I2]|uniref:hypothetical protein n=1 Tax=Cellulosilyticum sp. I15G10I2 TaxID=1892843 RepID=UPI001A9A312D|nr:hypothetical protein [Cellulosilyticum sp. I15G10I2]